MFLGGNIFGNLIAANYEQEPTDPVAGQIYFDTALKQFLGFNGEVWVELNGLTVGTGDTSDESPLPLTLPEPSEAPATPVPYVRTPGTFHVESGTPMIIDVNRTLSEIQGGNTGITCIRIKLSSNAGPITYASPFLSVPETGGVHYTFNNLSNGVFYSVRYHVVENCGLERDTHVYLEGGPNSNVIFEYSQPQ